MQLNTMKPAYGAKHAKKRLGRGVASGLGKTAGRGHKGQHARAGNSHKPGFEGGQMPLQRRLPKFGFVSRKALVSAEVRLGELNRINGDVVNLETLKKANLISASIEFVKIFASGEIKKPVTVKQNRSRTAHEANVVSGVSGIRLTAGAKKAIEAAGGSVE